MFCLLNTVGRGLNRFFRWVETSERLCRSQDVTAASIKKGVGNKWVKFQLWVNDPFKAQWVYVLTIFTTKGRQDFCTAGFRLTESCARGLNLHTASCCGPASILNYLSLISGNNWHCKVKVSAAVWTGYNHSHGLKYSVHDLWYFL